MHWIYACYILRKFLAKPDLTELSRNADTEVGAIIPCLLPLVPCASVFDKPIL